MKLTTKNNKLVLEYDGKTVFEHDEGRPFVTLTDVTLSYKSSFGNFKVKEKINDKYPLTDYRIEEEGDKNVKLVFKSEKYNVAVDISEADGCLTFTFNAGHKCGVELRFAAVADEGIFGGGEQFRQLDMKGEKINNFVSEHIVIPPIVQKTILGFLPYKEKPHKKIETYAPMSTYVSSEKYAVRVDANCFGVADFTKSDVSTYRFEKCPQSVKYFVADSFKALGRALATDVENNEYLPDWAYDGMILGVQGGIEKVTERALNMQKQGAKICGVWCQDWSGKKITAVGSQVYWNWEVDDNTYGDLKNNIEKLKEKGIRFLAYINPYLIENGRLYNLCKEKGYLIKRVDGSVYHIKSTTFNAGMLDLTNPDAVKFIKETLIKHNMLDLGIDGYMADFGEYLPVDSVLHDGDAEVLHNEWPVMWAKLNREAVNEHPRRDEIFFFTRSGYNGTQKYTTIMWNGDQHTDYTKDYGMPCVMPATFNLGFSGVTAVHSDVGGFTSFNKMARDDELFVRWMEMNTFSPLMRSHETIRPAVNAQYDNAVTAPYTVKLSAIHAALKPYLKELMAEANDGVMMMRPDFYVADDYSATRDKYSYFLGDDIFIAPVIEKGATSRKVYLPEGEWVHFFTHEAYKAGEYLINTTLGEPAVFYRADSKFKTLFESIVSENK